MFWILAICFLVPFTNLTDPLLKMSEQSTCIRDAIDSFIEKKTCQNLSQIDKTIIAIKMTNCLNAKVGKDLIRSCESLKECKIIGDDWNTFTGFFTHIDNLCHFYWEVLQHQRTEHLVESLSGSAILSEQILRQNFQSTQKILSMQQVINKYMGDSLQSNKKLSQTLKISQEKIQNMTVNLGEFMLSFNSSIDKHYSSIIKFMQTISTGIQGVNAVQSVMMSEVNSISGFLYFLLMTLIISLLTSFRFARKIRIYCFALLICNVILEVCLPQFMLYLIGIQFIRSIIAFVLVGYLVWTYLRRENQFDKIKVYMDSRLQTERIRRIFKESVFYPTKQNQQ